MTNMKNGKKVLAPPYPFNVVLRRFSFFTHQIAIQFSSTRLLGAPVRYVFNTVTVQNWL